MKRKSGSRKVIVYFSVFAALLLVLFFINQQTNKATSNNVYGIPSAKLSKETLALLDNPNYQNIVLPDELNQKIAEKESFFVYFFSSTCPFCIETTPKLNPLIAEAGVNVLQFNLDVFRDGYNKYDITYTPTLVFYENGVQKERIEGGMLEGSNTNSAQAFADFLAKHKGKASS